LALHFFIDDVVTLIHAVGFVEKTMAKKTAQNAHKQNPKVKILSAERKRLDDQDMAEFKANLLKLFDQFSVEEIPAVAAQLKKKFEEIIAKCDAEDAEERARKPNIIAFRERVSS
jgi:hypothetical protein